MVSLTLNMLKGVRGLSLILGFSGILIVSDAHELMVKDISNNSTPSVSSSNSDVNAIHSLTCEGSTAYLSCNGTYVIWINHAVYGRGSDLYCKKDGHMKTTTCVAGNSFEVVSQRCNGLKNCDIKVSNSVFGGDPCKGTYKYLELQYSCVADRPEEKACENGRVSMNCSSGKVISVTSALYGRGDDQICLDGPIKTTTCVAGNSFEVVAQRCNLRGDCTIDASNSVFGDPCKGTYKYLKVTYECIPDQPDRYVCEHDAFTISCGYGKIIAVRSAGYGRGVDKVCQDGSIKSTTCVAGNSFEVVTQRCQGRNYCSVPASNSVFGDPCKGTFKYLKIQFKCVSSGQQMSFFESIGPKKISSTEEASLSSN